MMTSSWFARDMRAAFLSLWLIAGTALATGVGDPAPSFALPDARGETISLDKLRGRVLYVDFWASWCGPCRRSFPWMNQLHQRYSDRGLTILAVNVDKNRADAERFLQQNSAQFTVVYDSAGVTPLAYAVLGMPSTYLIDGRGSVVAVEQGFHDDRKAALEERIRSLLAGR